jgi:hypothetical protein
VVKRWATDWTIGVLGFDSRRRVGNFSLHHRVQNDSGAHPTSYPMGTRVSFPGGKAVGAWSWTRLHLVPRSKNAWSYTSTPQYVSLAWCSFKKAQGQLYLLPSSAMRDLWFSRRWWFKSRSSGLWRGVVLWLDNNISEAFATLTVGLSKCLKGCRGQGGSRHKSFTEKCYFPNH